MRQLQIRLHENFATITYDHDHDRNPKEDLRTTTLTYIYINYHAQLGLDICDFGPGVRYSASCLESSRNALSTEQERESC